MKAIWNKVKTWMNTGNHLLWVSTMALIALGLIGMFFIGPYEAARLNMATDIFFNKYLPFVIVGIVLLFAFSKLSKKWIIRLSWILGAFAFLLILKTIIAPIIILGTARYVRLGYAYIDPFIMMLPAYIVLMSHWLSKDKANKTWTTIGTTALTLFIVLAAFRAPYVFMAQVYMLLFIIMTFKARKNVPGAFYLGIGTLVAFAALMILAAFTMPHVQTRLMYLVENNPMYSQSWYAVKALTHSTLIGSTPESLAALKALPESVSDYMFTGMVAKFGILMGLLILTLYGFIAKGLANIIRNTKDQFNKMLSIGTLWLFAIYTIVALIVAFGILATAAYWPFINYGGTMLFAWCILFGFVLAANRK